jgi:hypothetical protein
MKNRQSNRNPDRQGEFSWLLGNFGLMPISLAGAGLTIAWNLKLMFLIAGMSMVLITAFGFLQKEVRAME